MLSLRTASNQMLPKKRVAYRPFLDYSLNNVGDPRAIASCGNRYNQRTRTFCALILPIGGRLPDTAIQPDWVPSRRTQASPTHVLTVESGGGTGFGPVLLRAQFRRDCPVGDPFHNSNYWSKRLPWTTAKKPPAPSGMPPSSEAGRSRFLGACCLSQSGWCWKCPKGALHVARVSRS